jgi:parallel beta-helix repeat protein
MNRWSGRAVRVDFSWAVVLAVLVAAVMGPSPLMAQTVITVGTTLTADVVGGVVIGAHHITLDCNGRRISGGITLTGKSGVTVKNCVVTGAGDGVTLTSSSGNMFEANTVEGNTGGFHLIGSVGNTFKGNKVGRNSQFGFKFEGFSAGNMLGGNTIANNGRGVDVFISPGNFIVNNNFVDNQVQAVVVGPIPFFANAAPTGGNYWSDFDTASEGCSDLNSNNFCDVPRVFDFGGRDLLPWTKPFGQQAINVTVDVKPGDSNTVNLRSQGTTPVAIYSTDSFDASTLDPRSLTLAGGTVAVRANGTVQASLADVNGDGRLDLVVHVYTDTMNYRALTGQTGTVTLEGRTYNGELVRGTDSVRIVPQ